MPAAIAAFGEAGGSLRPCTSTAARVGAVDAEDRARHLRAPRADEARERDDLARLDLERDVREDALAREAVDLEHGRADLGDLLGEERVQVAPDHRVDQPLLRRLRDRLGRDVAPVAHHRDALAEREDLVEPVRDEEHRRALRAQRLDDAEEAVDLRLRERGGGLVHDDHARLGRERLGDLDDLLVGDREPARDAVGVELDAELVEQALDLAPHRARGRCAGSSQRLGADEDVLGDRQIREQRGLLEDDGDAGRVRLRGRVEDDLLAVDQHPPAVGPVHAGEDLDERRLAGAVLADERVRLAAAQLDPAVLERAHRAEALARVVDHEQRRVAVGRAASDRRRQARWKISSSSARPSSGR